MRTHKKQKIKSFDIFIVKHWYKLLMGLVPTLYLFPLALNLNYYRLLNFKPFDPIAMIRYSLGFLWSMIYFLYAFFAYKGLPVHVLQVDLLNFLIFLGLYALVTFLLNIVIRCVPMVVK